MANRVTNGLMYNQSQETVNQAKSSMMRTQEQAVTGKKANRPSDDPVGQARAITLRTGKARTEQVSQNLEMASSFLNMTDASLGELTEVISRAKELAVQMSNSTNQSEDARLASSHEIDQLLLRAVQIGNTRVGDRYIFGGYQTTRAPFDQNGNYYGDSGVIELELDQGQRISVNMPGIAPFFGKDDLTAEQANVRLQDGKGLTPTIQAEMRAPASLEHKADKESAAAVEAEKSGAVAAPPKDSPGVNLFNVLKNFSAGLHDGNVDVIHGTLDGLDGAFRQVISARSLVGARSNALQSGMKGLENAVVSNSELLSQAEDADTLKVFSDLTKTEGTLKAALETNKRILSNSLLDFLK